MEFAERHTGGPIIRITLTNHFIHQVAVQMAIVPRAEAMTDLVADHERHERPVHLRMINEERRDYDDHQRITNSPVLIDPRIRIVAAT